MLIQCYHFYYCVTSFFSKESWRWLCHQIPAILELEAIFAANMDVELLCEKVTLLPEKAIWFKERKLLLLADLHFGKINHFRKSGIPVPARANDKNTELLINLLNQT